MCVFYQIGQFFEAFICMAVDKMPDDVLNYIQLYKTFCSKDVNLERVLLIESIHLLYLLVVNNLSAFHAQVPSLSQFVHF